MPRLMMLPVIGFLLLLGACKQQIYGDLPERDADSMIAILSSDNIPVERVAESNGKFSLKVDSGRISEAASVLSRQGYPRKRFKSISDVFPGGGLIESPTEEKARYEYALSQEFENSITGLAGVIDARVQVSLGARDLQGRVVSDTTASVLVRYGPNGNLLELPTQVRELVAGGVAGLSRDKVHVVMTPASAPVATESSGDRVSWLQSKVARHEGRPETGRAGVRP